MVKNSDILFLLITGVVILSACGGDKEVKKDEEKKEPVEVTVNSKPQKNKTEPTPAPKTSSSTYSRPKDLKTIPVDTTAQVKKTTPIVQSPKTSEPAKVPETTVVKAISVSPDTTDTAGSSVPPVKTTKVETQPEAILTKPQTVVPTAVIISPETTEVILPAPKSPESEILASTLNSLLFDDVYFDANETATPSLTFNSNYLITLSKVVKALKADPKINVCLKGYTTKAGSSEKDREVSLKRAITVGKLILDLFPAEEKEAIACRIEVVPAGSDELLIEGNNRIKEMLNRRVSIELFNGKVAGSALADFIYPGKEAKVTVVSTAPKSTEKPAPKPVQIATKPTQVKVSTQEVLYSNGQKLYDRKKYSEAISTFEELVSLNPQNPLADNAQWWIGECFYSQSNYVDALNAFQKVFELGDRSKAAYAQLRIGYCYQRLNQSDMAKNAWEKVINNYPDATEEVAKAKKVLQYSGSK
jgi:tol-pal system protein YbgF